MDNRNLPTDHDFPETSGITAAPSLTKELKAKGIGLNATKLFKVNVEEKGKDLLKDCFG